MLVSCKNQIEIYQNTLQANITITRAPTNATNYNGKRQRISSRKYFFRSAFWTANLLFERTNLATTATCSRFSSEFI